jgi:hypothetical protein
MWLGTTGLGESHTKRSHILHKILNKTSGQSWCKKSQMSYDLV